MSDQTNIVPAAFTHLSEIASDVIFCRFQKAEKTAEPDKNEKTSQPEQKSKPKEKLKFPPCETCKKTNHSTDKCYFGANAANRPPPRNRKDDSKEKTPKPNNPSNKKTEPEDDDLNC